MFYRSIGQASIPYSNTGRHFAFVRCITTSRCL